jgi:hypothetical protein
MSSNLDKYQTDLNRLIRLADDMLIDLHFKGLPTDQEVNPDDIELKTKYSGVFEKNYQKWYTESSAVIRQLIPDRLTEFISLYKGEGRRKDVSSINFTVQDWLMGLRSNRGHPGGSILTISERPACA